MNARQQKCEHNRWEIVPDSDVGSARCSDCGETPPMWMLFENLRKKLVSLVEQYGTVEDKFVNLYMQERAKRMQLEQIMQQAIEFERRANPVIEAVKLHFYTNAPLENLKAAWIGSFGEIPPPPPSDAPPADQVVDTGIGQDANATA